MKKSKTTKSNYIPLEKLTVKCKKIGLSEQALSSILQWGCLVSDENSIDMKQKINLWEEKNKYGLTAENIKSHLDRIITRWEIGDGSFLYEWATEGSNGVEKYNAGAVSELYKDLKFIEECLYINPDLQKKLIHILKKRKSIVELGTGWVNKLYEFLQKNPAFYDRKVVLLDINSEWFSNIQEQLVRSTKNHSIEGVVGNFFDNKGSFYTLSSPIYFMFGGTIGNFTMQEIEKILKSMEAKRPMENSYFCFSYFRAPTTTDPEEYQDAVNKIKAMYWDADSTNPHRNYSTIQTKSDFYLSGLEALGIPREKLCYQVEYEEAYLDQPARIKAWAKAIEDIVITGPDWATTYTLAKGEKIWALQSQRFDENDIEKIAQSSGFTIVDNTYTDHMGTVILKSKLWINQRYKTMRNVAVSLAVVLWLWWVGSTTVEHNNQLQIEQKVDNHLRSTSRVYSKDKSQFWIDAKCVEFREIQTSITSRVFDRFYKGTNTETHLIEDLKYEITQRLIEFLIPESGSNNVYSRYLHILKHKEDYPEFYAEDLVIKFALSQIHDRTLFKRLIQSWFDFRGRDKNYIISPEDIDLFLNQESSSQVSPYTVDQIMADNPIFWYAWECFFWYLGDKVEKISKETKDVLKKELFRYLYKKGYSSEMQREALKVDGKVTYITKGLYIDPTDDIFFAQDEYKTYHPGWILIDNFFKEPAVKDLLQ